jgi:catalase
VQTPRQVEGPTVRAQPASFDDHFTQAAMFYRSLTYVEQVHIIEAFTFELGKCYEQAIKERQLEVLANVDADLCKQVAIGLGLPAPKGKPPQDVFVSPALSQIVDTPGPIDGRKIGIIAGADSDLAGVAKLVSSIQRLGATPLVTAPFGGVLKSGRRSVVVERTLLTARSIEYDALVIAAGTMPTNDIKLVVLLQEAFRHCKAVAAWGDGTEALEAAGIGLDAPGVLVGDSVDRSFTDSLAKAVGLHRVWERAVDVMASEVAPVR